MNKKKKLWYSRLIDKNNCSLPFRYYLAFVKAVPMGHQITIERSLDIDESSEEFINSQNPGLCTTKFCHQMANTLLESKDDSVHPCDDFYLHACGNWIKKNPIPDNELEWSRDREILHKTIERIRDLLEEDDCNDIPPVKLAKKILSLVHGHGCDREGGHQTDTRNIGHIGRLANGDANERMGFEHSLAGHRLYVYLADEQKFYVQFGVSAR
uniref:Venom protein n=1 Tax=Ampulex compressa TaxID=860918 RepID=A0A1W6EW74_AMPCP|nr:venom protein [Ampulex compressa]